MSDVTITAIVVALIGAIPATLVAILTRLKVQELHVLINSNLDKQLTAAVAGALAAGQLQGTQEGAELARVALEDARQGVRNGPDKSETHGGGGHQ
jgi:hypothetical protein